MPDSGELLAAKFEAIFPHLDERQRRLLLGAEARVLGHGGIRVVARAAGVREATVSLGAAELEAGAEPLGRARRPGGGRKRLADLDPGLRPALLALVEPDERGDPMSPLRWTTKSLRALSAELTRRGHRAGADTVADLLREEGFSLQGNAKTIEGRRRLPQARQVTNRLRRPDQLPQTRIRLGPYPPGPQARGSDLVRPRSIHPQPDQDRHPGRLTHHRPAAIGTTTGPRTYYDDFFRVK